MSSLNNLIVNIANRLDRHEFNVQEVQNILFLIDWRAALSEKPSISNLEWEIGNDGAYSKSFMEKLSSDTKQQDFIKQDKIKISQYDLNIHDKMNTWQDSIILFTTSRIKKLNSNEFDNLIKSIFPMKLERYIPINLSKIAKEYLESGISIQTINFKDSSKG